jgi:hypothetical protein
MKSLYKYAKSFIDYDPPIEQKEETWLSVLILFVSSGKMWIDSGYIFEGNVPINIYSYFTNFNNFLIVNNKLHYRFPENIKEINPKEVYLHLKIVKSKFSLPKNNLNNWMLHFSTSTNNLYKVIKHDLKKEKIRIVDVKETTKKMNILDAENPLFKTRQVYNDTSILFSEIDINYF